MKKKITTLIIVMCMFVSMCMIMANANEIYIPVAEDTYSGHTYQVFDESISWTEAKEYCESIGGHLVTINSEEENSFLTELISEKEKNLYWIGCKANADNV